MIRTKGEAGTGNVVEAVRHMRTVTRELRAIATMDDAQLMSAARDHEAPFDLVREVASSRKLPVVNFAAGGIATPADAADDVARRRRCVRRIGHLQELRAEAYAGRSSRRPRSGTSPKWWQRSPAVWAKPCPGSRSAPSGRQSASPSEDGEMTNIGVLALQGDVREHVHILESLGVAATPVKTTEQLGSIDALVIPGGVDHDRQDGRPLRPPRTAPTVY